MKQYLILLIPLFIGGCVTRTPELVKSGIFVSFGGDQHFELTIREDGLFSESILGNPYTATIGENRDTLIFTEQILSTGEWEQKGVYVYLYPEHEYRRKLRLEVSDEKVRLKGKNNIYTSAKANWAEPVAGVDASR